MMFESLFPSFYEYKKKIKNNSPQNLGFIKIQYLEITLPSMKLIIPNLKLKRYRLQNISKTLGNINN